jgi:hypothetical protein
MHATALCLVKEMYNAHVPCNQRGRLCIPGICLPATDLSDIKRHVNGNACDERVLVAQDFPT